MKAKRVQYLLTAVLILVLFLTILVYINLGTSSDGNLTHASRRVYIGDIITLEIEAEHLSRADVRAQFSDFEVVELIEEPGQFVIAVRTFAPGEYRVLLADKEVVINVGSTLEDIERDEVFEGSSQILKPGFFLPWHLLCYAAAGVFILSGAIVLFKAILSRRKKQLTPYQVFLKAAEALPMESGSYFVDLTLLFKQYLESLYHTRIIGKTSTEIVGELGRLQALTAVLPEIEQWLAECDQFKFSGVRVGREQKQEHYQKLIELAVRIDKQSSAVQEEGAG